MSQLNIFNSIGVFMRQHTSVSLSVEHRSVAVADIYFTRAQVGIMQAWVM